MSSNEPYLPSGTWSAMAGMAFAAAPVNAGSRMSTRERVPRPPWRSGSRKRATPQGASAMSEPRISPARLGGGWGGCCSSGRQCASTAYHQAPRRVEWRRQSRALSRRHPQVSRRHAPPSARPRWTLRPRKRQCARTAAGGSRRGRCAARRRRTANGLLLYWRQPCVAMAPNTPRPTRAAMAGRSRMPCTSTLPSGARLSSKCNTTRHAAPRTSASTESACRRRPPPCCATGKNSRRKTCASVDTETLRVTVATRSTAASKTAAAPAASEGSWR